MPFDGTFTPEFERLLLQLPAHTQAAAVKNFELWLADNRHNSLHFKKLKIGDRNDIYSMRVSDNYRMLGKRVGNLIKWYWIGPRHAYDKKLRKY